MSNFWNIFNRKSSDSASQPPKATRPVELVEMPEVKVTPVEGPGGMPKEDEGESCPTCGAPRFDGTECQTCGYMPKEPTMVEQMETARDSLVDEIEEEKLAEADADADADVLETLTLEVVGLNNHLQDVKERAQKALARKAQAEADAKALLGMLGKGKKIEYLTPAQRVEKAEAEKAKDEAEAKRLEKETEAKAEAASLEAERLETERLAAEEESKAKAIEAIIQYLYN